MAERVRVMHHGKVVPIPNQAPMVIEVGVRGVPGPKGDSLTFDDLTAEQKAELKGEKGDPGDVSNVIAIDTSAIDNLF